MVINYSKISWFVPLALAMPIVAFRHRVPGEGGSIDAQIIVRILPLLVLSLFFFKRAMPVLKGVSANSLLLFWLVFLSFRTFLLLNSSDPIYGAMYIFYQTSATVVVLGFYSLSVNRFHSDFWWERIIIRFIYFLIIMGPIAFLISPDALWFSELQSDGSINRRYSGGIGHPFTVGEVGFICVGVSFLFVNNKIKMMQWLLLGVLMMAASQTKTWVFSSFICICFLLWLSSKNRYLLLTVVLLLCGYFILFLSSFGVDGILRIFSRSGSVEEMLTLTGRTDFWPKIVTLWLDKPFFGYGTGSSKILLYYEAAGEYFKPTHAHNLYLQILLEGGAFLFVGLLLYIKGYVKSSKELLRCEPSAGKLSCYIGLGMLLSSVTTIPGLMFYDVSFIVWLVLAVKQLDCNRNEPMIFDKVNLKGEE